MTRTILPTLLLLLLTHAAAAQPASLAPGSRLEEGPNISVDWKDADLTDVLRLFHELTGMNIVVSEAARGKTVTLALHDVPWRQALDLVLQVNGLVAVEDGNVVRIAPPAVLTAEERARADYEQARQLSAPLRTVAYPLSWTDAASAEALVKKTLSPRGSVSVDKRTNTLIVTDVDPLAGVSSFLEDSSPAMAAVTAPPPTTRLHLELWEAPAGAIDIPLGAVAAWRLEDGAIPPAAEKIATTDVDALLAQRIVLGEGAGEVTLALERNGDGVVLVVRPRSSGRGTFFPAQGEQCVVLPARPDTGKRELVVVSIDEN
jgi:type IV pilus assembly protein PilQ